MLIYPSKLEGFLFNKNEWKSAVVAQLGERQTEDLKVPGSIPGDGTECFVFPEAPHSDLKRWFVHKKLLCFDSFCIVK